MTTRNRSFVRLVPLLVGVLAPVFAQADTKLYVQSPAAYAPDAGYVQKVKDECAVETKLADHVRNQVGKQFSEIVPIKEISEAGQGLVLGLTIFEIYGVGGGFWSGSKSITAEAKLQQDGKVLGTFKDKNSSRGGALGGFKGTCSILDRVAEHYSEDVAEWLAELMKERTAANSAKPEDPSATKADK